MPKSFDEVRNPREDQADQVDPIEENLLRRGAALGYGAKSRGHGQNMLSHLQKSNQALASGAKTLQADEKLDQIAKAIAHQNDALIELRKQIGASVSVMVSMALFIEKQSGRRR